MLRVIRREIRRDAGFLIDQEDLGTAIHQMLSQEARELVGPLRIRRHRIKRGKEAPSSNPEEGKCQPDQNVIQVSGAPTSTQDSQEVLP